MTNILDHEFYIQRLKKLEEDYAAYKNPDIIPTIAINKKIIAVLLGKEIHSKEFFNIDEQVEMILKKKEIDQEFIKQKKQERGLNARALNRSIRNQILDEIINKQK